MRGERKQSNFRIFVILTGFILLFGQFLKPADAALWYVNDNSQTGDSYTTAVGNDANIGSSAAPFLTITYAISAAASGDTILIDAGNYVEAVTVTKDTIALIGADSSATIIGISSTLIDTCIYARNRSGLTIKNLKCFNSKYGLFFDNTDKSLINNVTVDSTLTSLAKGGINLINGSETNIISNCYTTRNWYGTYIYYSYADTIMNCYSYNDRASAYYLYYAHFGSLLNNVSDSNSNSFNLKNVGYGSSIHSHNFLIQGNASINSYTAFYLTDCDTIVVNNNSSSGDCIGGIFDNSNGLTITNNLITNQQVYNGNQTRGFSFSSSQHCFVSKNSFISGAGAKLSHYVFQLSTTCNDNIISENNISGFSQLGGAFTIDHTSNNNRVVSNTIYNNVLDPAVTNYNALFSFCKAWPVDYSSSNYFAQNLCDSNQNVPVCFYDTTTPNSTVITIERNNFSNIDSSTDSYVVNKSINTYNLINNYWGTTDSAVLSSKMKNTGSGSIVWAPFSFSAIDTNPGADTAIPGTVSITGGNIISATSAAISWSASQYTGTAGGDGLAGYRIFRARVSELVNGDTANWYAKLYDTVSYTMTSYTDNSRTSGESYVYRVTAFDNHTTNGVSYSNESWFSAGYNPDSSSVLSGIYVNDTSTTGDKITSAIGYDTNAGTNLAPYRTIAKARSMARSGDIIYIDAGTYSETVVIDTNNLSLIGADSWLTIIDPPGDSSTTTLYGIYADTQTNLTIRNLRITRCYYGINFYNVNNSLIDNITADWCGNAFTSAAGIYLQNNSCTNTVRNCYAYKNNYGIYLNSNSNANTISGNTAYSNTLYGIYLKSSSNNNTISGNTANSNSSYGITLGTSSNTNTISGNTANQNGWSGFNVGTNYNTISGNTTNSNTNRGIYLVTSSYNTISGNTSTLNAESGFYLASSSNTNTLTSNTAYSNTQYGFFLQSSSNNTLSGNTAYSNTNDGFFLQTNTTYNTLTGNTSYSNTQSGFFLSTNANTNTLTANISRNNSQNGFYMSGSANNLLSGNTTYSNQRGIYLLNNANSNTLRGNIINSNSYGVYLFSSSNNMTVQNDIMQNTSYQIYITTSASVDTFLKNNIQTSGVNSDSSVYNDVNSSFDLRYNYWSTTDSSIIANRIKGTYADQVSWAPFMFSQIDTNVNADTVEPGTVSITTTDTSVAGQVRLVWTASVYSGVADDTGLAGYNIFRACSTQLTNSDTGNWYWHKIATVGRSDTTYTDTSLAVGVYYYRVTTFDSHLNNGTSYYNECWYSPTSIAIVPYSGPVWYVNDNSQVGDSYTSAVGNNANSGASNAPFLTIAKALTVAKSGDTIYVDAGTYSETVVIDTNNITLIGADSSLTIIDPAGNKNTSGLYGIYTANRTNLRLFKLRVTDCDYGIYLNNGDTSIIDNVTVDLCNRGIYLYNGSVSNTVSNCYVYSNDFGIFPFSNSNYNIISNNKAISNTTAGIYLRTSNNTVSGNQANSNMYGIYLNLSSNTNTISGNQMNSNSQYGIYLNSSSNNNIISHNQINLNTNAGIYLYSSSSYNLFFQNDILKNTNYQIDISAGSAYDTFLNNNIQTSSSNPVSAVSYTGATPIDMRYNYWFSSDSQALRNGMQGSGYNKINWQPFSFSQIDTSAGADTIAPDSITNISADTSVSNQITIRWNIPAYSGSLGGAGLAGYHLFRAKSSELTNGDTSNWYGKLYATVNYTDTSYTDTDITLGPSYYYRVTAFDSHITNGTVFRNESWFSDKVIITTNQTPSLNLSFSAMTAYEDTAAWTMTLTGSNISDSDVADTIGTMTVSVLDTDLIKAVISNNGATQVITFTVFADTFGVDTMTMKVTDSSGAYDTKIFVLTISNVNDTPIITSTAGTTATQNIKYYYQMTAIDTDIITGSQLSIINYQFFRAE